MPCSPSANKAKAPTSSTYLLCLLQERPRDGVRLHLAPQLVDGRHLTGALRGALTREGVKLRGERLSLSFSRFAIVTSISPRSAIARSTKSRMFCATGDGAILGEIDAVDPSYAIADE